jgi:hypothetical protein
MATSEIEKLERRYAENPHGLTFAPLAEVHRKNGDVARALELLTAGLELHPNYIPASIVLGRCHQDLGDLAAAEAAFAHVLRLDDENVIALKSLADINERQERFGEAENWLRRLIAVDRTNDEAHEQLRRLDAREKKAEAAPQPAATSGPVLEVIDLDEPAAKGPGSAAAESDVTPAELLPVDIAALELSSGHAEKVRRPKDAPQPSWLAASAPPPDVEAEGPIAAEVATTSPAEPEDAAPAETVPPVAGLISAEFEPPLEAIGGLGVETSEEVILEVSGNSEFRVPDASEDFRALADRLSPPPERPAATAPPAAAPKVAETASRTAAEPKPVPLWSTGEENVGTPATRRSYLAQTKGRSVASFFHSLLAARPPASDGVGGADDALPVPPAVPAAKKPDGAVSFDDFFGADTEGSTPGQRGGPGKDDLDQFQTWLQNLKR